MKNLRLASFFSILLLGVFFNTPLNAMTNIDLSAIENAFNEWFLQQEEQYRYNFNVLYTRCPVMQQSMQEIVNSYGVTQNALDEIKKKACQVKNVHQALIDLVAELPENSVCASDNLINIFTIKPEWLDHLQQNPGIRAYFKKYAIDHACSQHTDSIEKIEADAAIASIFPESVCNTCCTHPQVFDALIAEGKTTSDPAAFLYNLEILGEKLTPNHISHLENSSNILAQFALTCNYIGIEVAIQKYLIENNAECYAKRVHDFFNNESLQNLFVLRFNHKEQQLTAMINNFFEFLFETQDPSFIAFYITLVSSVFFESIEHVSLILSDPIYEYCCTHFNAIPRNMVHEDVFVTILNNPRLCECLHDENNWVFIDVIKDVINTHASSTFFLDNATIFDHIIDFVATYWEEIHDQNQQQPLFKDAIISTLSNLISYLAHLDALSDRGFAEWVFAAEATTTIEHVHAYVNAIITDDVSAIDTNNNWPGRVFLLTCYKPAVDAHKHTASMIGINRDISADELITFLNNTPPQQTYSSENFGNKTANLKKLEDCINQGLQRPNGTIQIKIPHFIGCSHDHVDAFLQQQGLSLAQEWENIIQAEHITAEELFKTKQFSPHFYTRLSALQNRIKQCCSTPYPFDDEELNFFAYAHAQQRTLMVRSTGAEDSSTMANAGGNESIANVTPTSSAITTAMGDVIASYISKKSLQQRLCCARTLNDVYALLAPPFFPVLIQEMIGETTPSSTISHDEYIKTIPVSGVMFTTDPESALPHITLIQTTFGHNQGVVNSEVPVDSWYISKTHEIRSLIKQKTTRLAPSSNELIHVNNITPHGEDFSHYPTLTNEQALALKHVATVIEAAYNMPMDIEFVCMPSLNCIYLVQARPIVQQRLHRTILDPAWLDQQPQDTFLTCDVISAGKAQPIIFTQRNRLVCTKTLAQALVRVLGLPVHEQVTVKAVIVTTPPASTSHEATTFRALQIPVLCHQDQKVVQAWRAAQKDLFLLDPQRGLFIPCSQEQAQHLNDVIVPGWIQSPIEQTIAAPTFVEAQPDTHIVFTYSLFPAVRAFWADTLSNLSEEAHARLTDLLNEHNDPAILSFLITTYFPSTQPSTDISSHIIDECSRISQTQSILTLLQDYLHQLTTYDLAPFEHPQNFEHCWNFFSTILLHPSTTPGWNKLLNSAKKHALIKFYVLRCMNLLVECFDHAIKTVSGSPYYTKNDKATCFYTMVSAYWNLFEIWLSWMPQGAFQQARETFSNNRTPNLITTTLTQADIEKYLRFFSPSIKNKAFTEDDLLPTPSFSVMAATIGAGGRYEQFRPESMSLEDYFTLTHQNLLSLITILTQRINPINEHIVPEHVTQILQIFSQPLSFKKSRYEECNVEKGYSQFNASLIGVEIDHETCSWTYNIPLRGHSSRFIVRYHKQTEDVELECIFFRDAARKWIFDRVCAYLGTVYPSIEAQLIAMQVKDNAATINLMLSQKTCIQTLTAIITRSLILLFRESTFITIPDNELLTFEQAKNTLSPECFVEWSHHYALFYHESLQPGKKDTSPIPRDINCAQTVYAQQCLQELSSNQDEIINLVLHHPLFIEAYTTYLADNPPTDDDHAFYTERFHDVVQYLTTCQNDIPIMQLYHATLLLYNYCKLCVDTTTHELATISAWLLEVLHMLQNHAAWDTMIFEHSHIECSILSLMMNYKERLAPTQTDTLMLLQKIVITSLKNKSMISSDITPYQALYEYLVAHGQEESFAQEIGQHTSYFKDKLTKNFLCTLDSNQEYVDLLQKIFGNLTD